MYSLNLHILAMSFALSLSLQSAAQDVEPTESTIRLETHLAGHKSNGDVDLSAIKSSRGIFVTEVDDDRRWEIVSYKLKLDRGTRISECSTKGANYSNNCKAYVDALQVGNSIEVFEVKVMSKDGSIIDAPGLHLNIIEK